MGTHTRVFRAPKEGSQPSENQDAYALPDTTDGVCDLDEQRFAVTDGATEAMYSYDWARLLADGWHEKIITSLDGPGDAFSSLEVRWKAGLPTESFPWWAEEKVATGAFSTLLGLALDFAPDGTARMSMAAVGDTCLFIVRRNDLVFAEPLKHSKAFNSSPYLIGSSSIYNNAIKENVVTRCEKLYTDDRLILATDALACWCLSQIENNSDPSSLFLSFEQQPDKDIAFQAFLDAERKSNRMRNDDVTLMLIDLL